MPSGYTLLRIYLPLFSSLNKLWSRFFAMLTAKCFKIIMIFFLIMQYYFFLHECTLYRRDSKAFSLQKYSELFVLFDKPNLIHNFNHSFSKTFQKYFYSSGNEIKYYLKGRNRGRIQMVVKRVRPSKVPVSPPPCH